MYLSGRAWRELMRSDRFASWSRLTTVGASSTVVWGQRGNSRNFAALRCKNRDGWFRIPSWAKPRARIDNTMVKALARAFRWRKLLETDVYGTVEEIAAAEEINTSYVSRILRMTLQAPEIIEAIVDGCHPTELTLAKLMKPFPMEWRAQLRCYTVRFVGWCQAAVPKTRESATISMFKFDPRCSRPSGGLSSLAKLVC